MAFPIITADQRLAENRRSSGVILGPAGVGKTTLLKTTEAISDLLSVMLNLGQIGFNHLFLSLKGFEISLACQNSFFLGKKKIPSISIPNFDNVPRFS